MTEERSSRRGRRARGSLSSQEILDAGWRLVEREGLGQLSMPGLARELGSGVTSIYWYFRSKEELLEALAERAFRELHGRLPPVGDGAWEEELVTYFSAFRQLLTGNPVYREMVAFNARLLYRVPAAGAVRRRLDDGFGLLLRAGLSPAQAVGAYAALANYTRGFVVLEQGVQNDGGQDEVSGWSPDPDDYPALSRLPSDVDDPAPLDDGSFLTGLLLLVAGIGSQTGGRPGERRQPLGGAGAGAVRRARRASPRGERR